MEKRKPGRPKKTEEVPASLTVRMPIPTESTPDREPVVPKVELNNIAYSITRDPKSQHWLVLAIPYDIKTGTVGEIKRIEMNSERVIILERFEILSQNEFYR